MNRPGGGGNQGDDAELRTDTQALSARDSALDDVFEFPISSESVDQIAPALAAAAASIKNAAKDSENTFFKNESTGRASTYASLASVFDACRPHLAENGISVLQPITRSRRGEPLLVTRLLHASGQWVQSVVFLNVAARVAAEASGQAPAEPEPTEIPGTEKKKKKRAGVQDIAAEITYFRRACLSALAGVAAEDDDDGNDAQAATTRPLPPRPAAGGPPRGGPPR